jgi:hypothetical protein
VIASGTDAASEIWLKSGRLALLAAATAVVGAFGVNIALSGSAVSPPPPQVVLQRARAAVADPAASVNATLPQPSVVHLDPIVFPALASVAPSFTVPARKKRSRATDEAAKTPEKTRVSKSVLRRYGI